MKKIIIFTLFLIVFLGACVNYSKTEFTPCSDCNIILISIDTLRPDHLGVYGYYKNTSPNIDKLSSDSVVFRNVISQASSTEPSHASIFTSLLPSQHNALFAKNQKLLPRYVTMAEILKKAGYHTISFNGGAQVSEELGLDQGFDIYESINESSELDHFQVQIQKAEKWLGVNKEKKFFIFLHTYQVHRPYNSNHTYFEEFMEEYHGNLTLSTYEEYIEKVNKKGRLAINREDTKFIKALYDSEIKSVDKAYGDFEKYLKKNDLYDNSLIIFTSDHGEEFGERGKMAFHSHTLYDELIKVPLIIKFPYSDFSGRTIHTQVRSIDILPTLLDLVNISSSGEMVGQSLLPWILGEKTGDLVAISQLDRANQELPTSIRSRNWKLYGRTLYDLKNDSGETKDVSDENENIVTNLNKELQKQLNVPYNGNETKFKNETVSKLKSLGYIVP